MKSYRQQFENYLSTLSTSPASDGDSWGDGYVQGLTEIGRKAQHAGNLDTLLAVKQEHERFTREGTIPSRALSESIPELRALQRQYVQQPIVKAVERSRSVIKLYAKYDSALADLEARLTSQGNIESALAVRVERKRASELRVVSAALFEVAMYQFETGERPPGSDSTAALRHDAPMNDRTSDHPPDRPELLSPPEDMSVRGVNVYFARRPRAASETDLAFKRTSLMRTSHGPLRPSVSMSMHMASEEESNAWLGANIKTFSWYTRLTVQATPAAGTLRNVMLTAQYYKRSASTSSRLAPKVAMIKRVPFDVLPAAPVHLDFPALTLWTARGNGASFGEEFNGLVISVYDSDERLLFQGASHRGLLDLANRAMPGPTLEERPQDLLTAIEQAKEALAAARHRARKNQEDGWARRAAMEAGWALKQLVDSAQYIEDEERRE